MRMAALEFRDLSLSSQKRISTVSFASRSVVGSELTLTTSREAIQIGLFRLGQSIAIA
jgi:hypothetical protein